MTPESAGGGGSGPTDRFEAGGQSVVAPAAERPTATHGAIALDIPACTSCNLCVTECPTWCISLSAHTERVDGPGRAKRIKVLDDFAIDFGLCMYCGICVEVCPFDALAWVPGAVSAGGERGDLRAGMAELGQWWDTQMVPVGSTEDVQGAHNGVS